MKYRNIPQQVLRCIFALVIISVSHACEKGVEEEKIEININPIPDLLLYENFGSVSIDLDTIFIVPPGNSLSFEAIGKGYLEINISDNIVKFSEPEPETLTEEITITASSIDGQTVSSHFQISGKPSIELRIQGVWRRYEQTSPSILSPVEEIDFLNGAFILTDLTEQDGIKTGNYIVRNETFEISWDLDSPLGEDWQRITLLDQVPDEMVFNGMKWFLEISRWP